MPRIIDLPDDDDGPLGLYAPLRGLNAPDDGDGATPGALDVLGSVVARPQPVYGPGAVGATPDAPAARVLNQVVAPNGGRQLPYSQDADSGWRAPDGWPIAGMHDDQNDAAVGPYTAVAASGQPEGNALFAQANGPSPMSPELERRTRAAIGRENARPDREPPSRARMAPATDASGLPLPPWLVMERNEPPRPITVDGRAQYWGALQSQGRDQRPNRQIGPRLAEGLQAFFETEGGARQDSSSTAFAGITQQTLDAMRARLRQSDPELARSLGARPSDLTPTQWGLLLRGYFNEMMPRAGGVQAIEDIGNAAPETGSRELVATIVPYLLRDSGVLQTRRLQTAINDVVDRLAPDARARIQDRVPGRLAETGTFGANTRDALIALAQEGQAEALRIGILNAFHRDFVARRGGARVTDNDRDRIRWTQSLRLPSDR